jgi:uncharacterized membrane-anchored protein
MRPTRPPWARDILRRLDRLDSRLEKAEARHRTAPWTTLFVLGFTTAVAGLVAGFQASPEGIQWFPIQWWFVLFIAGVAMTITGGLVALFRAKKDGDYSRKGKKGGTIMKFVGAILFFIGVILVALSITATPSSNLLLAGIIIAGSGITAAWLFRSQ